MFYLDFSQLSFWKGLPGTSDSEESVCNVGDLGLIPGLGRSPGRQYSCLENPHGQRSLVGYTLWDLKESDMTEQLSISVCFWKTCIVEIIKNLVLLKFQFSSVTQSCPTLCNPMNRSTPGPPVHHHLPEFTQTHIH